MQLVSMEKVFCGNSSSLILSRMCWDGIEQRGACNETEHGHLWILVGVGLILVASMTVLLTQTWYLVDL